MPIRTLANDTTDNPSSPPSPTPLPSPRCWVCEAPLPPPFLAFPLCLFLSQPLKTRFGCFSLLFSPSCDISSRHLSLSLSLFLYHHHHLFISSHIFCYLFNSLLLSSSSSSNPLFCCAATPRFTPRLCPERERESGSVCCHTPYISITAPAALLVCLLSSLQRLILSILSSFHPFFFIFILFFSSPAIFICYISCCYILFDLFSRYSTSTS